MLLLASSRCDALTKMFEAWTVCSVSRGAAKGAATVSAGAGPEEASAEAAAVAAGRGTAALDLKKASGLSSAGGAAVSLGD